MKFRTWFKLWVASFLRILTFGQKKYKSERQREEERERRLKAKYANDKLYSRKKHRKARRRTASSQNVQFAMRVIDFFALSLGILFLPFGLFDWGYKSVKHKKRAKAVERAKAVTNSTKTAPATATSAIIAPVTTASAEKAAEKTAPAKTVTLHKPISPSQSLTYNHHNVSTVPTSRIPDQVSIAPSEQKTMTLEEMRRHTLSVLREGENDVYAVVQDKTKSLGKVWQDNIERFFAEYSVLLQAGKTQIGAVQNVSVSKGHITAEVFGEKKLPYKVIITVEPITQPCKDKITIRDIFPTKKDFWLFCNCGEEVCAHIFAVLYAVGSFFENDEKIFYRLRGMENAKL